MFTEYHHMAMANADNAAQQAAQRFVSEDSIHEAQFLQIDPFAPHGRRPARRDP